MRTARCAAVVAIALLVACAPPPREPAPAPPLPPQFDQAYYQQAAAQGRVVLRVDPAQSLAVIEVRRGGVLARFGHDHVVASHGVEGFIAPQDGRADLYVALDALSVDEPALRAEAMLDTQPSQADIEGTRANMLEKVLEADRFPHAIIRVRRIDTAASNFDVSLILHGVTRTFTVPVRIENAGGQMSASGRFSFDQSDFGITPFSILGGAIQVQDRVELRFQIRARIQP